MPLEPQQRALTEAGVQWLPYEMKSFCIMKRVRRSATFGEVRRGSLAAIDAWSMRTAHCAEFLKRFQTQRLAVVKAGRGRVHDLKTLVNILITEVSMSSRVSIEILIYIEAFVDIEMGTLAHSQTECQACERPVLGAHIVH